MKSVDSVGSALRVMLLLLGFTLIGAMMFQITINFIETIIKVLGFTILGVLALYTLYSLSKLTEQIREV